VLLAQTYSGTLEIEEGKASVFLEMPGAAQKPPRVAGNPGKSETRIQTDSEPRNPLAP
jgi:hypothetical protein